MHRSNKWGFNLITRQDFASNCDVGEQLLRDRRINAADMPLLAVAIVMMLVYLGGCASSDREIDLYVDAVMLRQQGENQKAVEKLNAAVQVDRKSVV